MALLNTQRLLGQWKTEHNPLVHASRVADTEWILKAAIGDRPIKGIQLDHDNVHALIHGFFEWRQSTGRSVAMSLARARVNRVLEQLNQIPGMHNVLAPEPVMVHRPTAHPPSARAFLACEQMMALDRIMLTWCRKNEVSDAWLLLLSLRLMTRLGMSENVMLGTLSMLTPQHIDKRSLAIPSSPEAKLPHQGHYRLSLHDDVWVPLRAVVTQATSRAPADWLLATRPETLAMPFAQRRKLVRKRLKEAAKQALKALKKHPDGAQWDQLRSWSTLVNASRHVPAMRGIPPLWATLLRQYPLPTCTQVPLLASSDSAHLYTPGELRGRLPDRVSVRNTNTALPTLGQQTRPPGTTIIPTAHLPVDWRRVLKNLLQQFLTEVARLSAKRVNAAKFDTPMQLLLVRYEKRLDRLIGHSGHYPGWVLQFLYHQLRTEGNKLSTARTLLSRLTPLTLLMHDAVLDLTDWDDELVLELQMAAQSGSQWSASTLASFQTGFRQFIGFCQSFGMLEEVIPPPRATSTLPPSVLRTRILSPDHMQTAWQLLTHDTPNGDSHQMMALVIALGFYGGLRASEVESLTLNTVAFGSVNDQGEGTCWIEILEGKTPAARRRVALHIMAPPSVVTHLRGWVQERQNECAAWPLSEVALFGPRHSPEAYVRKSLVTPVIEWMRYVLGEDIDFHGLRHASVSWTLLRLHASQHPHFRDTLQHRHHWMFQKQPLENILTYFCSAEGDDTLHRGTLLLHVVKFIGHREPGTLLENYAHTLGLIHSNILAPRKKTSQKSSHR